VAAAEVDVAFDLDGARGLLGLTQEEARKELQISDGARDGVRYEGLEHLTELYNPDVFPGRAYVQDGVVALVYVPHGPALEGVSPKQLAAEIGGEGTRLRSRAGKQYGHYVHAQQGVAYSADKEKVRFVEVFRPRSQEAYQADIYRESPKFKR